MSAIFTQDGFSFTPEMKKALAVSLFLHIGIVIFGIVGLPYIKKPLHIPQPIAVEVVDISELDTTNKKPNESKRKKPQEKPQPKIEKKIQAPPKVEAKAPPKIKPIEKPPEVKKETVKPKPKTPPPPKEKLEKPQEKKPEKKPEPKKEEVQVSEEDEFMSVLKNLQDGATPTEETDNTAKPAPAQESPLAKFAEKLSATEVSAIAAALNTQFSSCWNLMAGARNAEDIVVKINLKVRPDRTVQSARIVEQLRYNQDSFYRAAADEAMRAVRHPNCEVLDLPPDKYELWKDLIFNFNPSAQL